MLEGTADKSGAATWAFDDLVVTPSKPIAMAAANPYPSSSGTTVAIATPLPEAAPANVEAEVRSNRARIVFRNSAARCRGPILMQSGFDTLPAIWAAPSNNQSLADGMLEIRPDPHSLSWDSLDLGGGHDVEACVTVAGGDGPGGKSDGGLAVGGGGAEISFTVDGAGRALISTNRVGDIIGWTDLVAPQANPAIKPAEEGNRLSVRIEGADAIFSVNGVDVASVKGAIPPGPLAVSLFGRSYEEVSTWKFDDLIVAAHPGDETPYALLEEDAAGCTGEAILRNGFDAPPGNGVPYPNSSVTDGKLRVDAEPNRATYLTWALQNCRDIDVCATAALDEGRMSYAAIDLAGSDGDVVFLVDQHGSRAAIYRRDGASHEYSTLVAEREAHSIQR